MGIIYHRNPRMEQVDISIYRATLLAKAKRKVAEAGGKSLKKSEVGEIVGEEWRKIAEVLRAKEGQ